MFYRFYFSFLFYSFQNEAVFVKDVSAKVTRPAKIYNEDNNTVMRLLKAAKVEHKN